MTNSSKLPDLIYRRYSAPASKKDAPGDAARQLEACAYYASQAGLEVEGRNAADDLREPLADLSQFLHVVSQDSRDRCEAVMITDMSRWGWSGPNSLVSLVAELRRARRDF